MSDAQADAAAAASADAIALEDEDDAQGMELGSFGISFSAVERFEMVSVPKTTGRKSAWTLEKLVDPKIATDELLASDPISFTQFEVSKNTSKLFCNLCLFQCTDFTAFCLTSDSEISKGSRRSRVLW
jgi:hypothetical protein